MSIELVSLDSRIWNLSAIQVCDNDPSENLPPEAGKDASPEAIAAPVSNPVNVDNDYYPTSQNAENCESLDVEGDKGAGKHNVAEENGVRITDELSSHRDSETPLPTGDGINEIHEMNVEIDTCYEQSKPDGDVEADASKHEPLLDVNGLETSDKNEDASDPTASVDVDASAGLLDQERGALSVELHSGMMDAYDRQAIEGVDVNFGFETESLVRDDVLLEVAEENATIEPQSSSKQGNLEFDEHNEMHSAMFGEDIKYSSYAAQQEQDYGFMENGRTPDQAEAHHHHMMGAESSGFDLHDQEEWKYSAAENDTDFLNVDDDELDEMADDHDAVDEEEARFIENTGWSSRTRAVSKYLQTLFVKEAEQGSKSLNLDHLLVGKTRKEASRMFFETLVLKTRDFIHVEQRDPFNGIAMKPRTRLMKSGF